MPDTSSRVGSRTGEARSGTESARFVGIGRDSAYELIRTGRWPVIRIGRRLRVPRRALEVWVEETPRSLSGNE